MVFNFRGRGGHSLRTPRTYCASNSEDLSEVIDHVRARYPKAPLMAMGVSLGGIILGNYLAHQGEAAVGKVKAAMLMSTVWDCFKGSDSLELWGFNRMLNRHLANCLVDSIREVRHVFDKGGLVDLQHVFQSSTVREFDIHFTAKQFGYGSVEKYYEDASLAGKLDRIRVPLLALNALDDPFSPGDSLPLEEAAGSDSVAILTTKYGGHIGFMEGLLPTRYHFSDRVFEQYAKAVFQKE